MKGYLKRSLIGILLIAFLLGIRSHLPVQTSKLGEKYGTIIGDINDNYKLYDNFTVEKKINSLPLTKPADTGVIINPNASGTVAGEIPGIEVTYDSTKNLSENIDQLNNALESLYGRNWTIENTLQDSRQAEPSDWVMVVEGDEIGIDISTWRSSYNSDTDKNKYLNAILETFRFFCGDNMGNSLWLLLDDLKINNGTDETVYGFKHGGANLTYTNGNVVTFEYNDNGSTLYLCLTPGNY